MRTPDAFPAKISILFARHAVHKDIKKTGLSIYVSDVSDSGSTVHTYVYHFVRNIRSTWQAFFPVSTECIYPIKGTVSPDF